MVAYDLGKDAAVFVADHLLAHGAAGEDAMHAALEVWNAEQTVAMLRLLATAAGASLEATRAAAAEIAGEVDRLGRGRKERPPFFADVCASVAKTLREMAR